MKPPRISKAVAKVLDELWPHVTSESRRLHGDEPMMDGWRDLWPSSRTRWVIIAKWHLDKLESERLHLSAMVENYKAGDRILLDLLKSHGIKAKTISEGITKLAAKSKEGK